VSGSRTVVTRGLSPLARHCAAYDSFELVRACLPALGSASRRRGRGCVPIDFCTPKPFNSSTRANRRFPALRLLIHIERLSATAWESHSYRASRLVLVHAKRLFSRSRFRGSEDRLSEHRAARATRCERGWGESRFTTRLPLRRPCERRARAFSSPARDRHDRLWHLCRLLRGSGVGRFR
jgi:hypothetical protein